MCALLNCALNRYVVLRYRVSVGTDPRSVLPLEICQPNSPSGVNVKILLAGTVVTLSVSVRDAVCVMDGVSVIVLVRVLVALRVGVAVRVLVRVGVLVRVLVLVRVRDAVNVAVAVRVGECCTL